ncbi:MAG: hypothetical protein R8G01_09645 [Ilumatobacteraceae bacterium]|nr:hypothetical protein [Ilumatobacteraceae bacterium]
MSVVLTGVVAVIAAAGFAAARPPKPIPVRVRSRRRHARRD